MRFVVAVSALVFVAGGALASPASAAEGDGAYGRLKGDVTLVVGAGAGIVTRDARKLAIGELRGRYLDAAGVSFQYEEGEAFARADSFGDVRRNFIGAVELKPLFPIRFLKNMQTGKSFGDLALDSFGLDVGAIWSVRQGNAVRRPGVLLGLGFEVPLFGVASGAWVRLSTSVRWTADRIEGDQDLGGRTVVFGLQLAWHQVVSTHAVDAGDERVE